MARWSLHILLFIFIAGAPAQAKDCDQGRADTAVQKTWKPIEEGFFHYLWNDYQFDYKAFVSVLKSEGVGVKKATWDVLVALTNKETWKALRKSVGAAGQECDSKHQGKPPNFWIGCMTIKFGKTMFEGITKAAKECLNDSFGDSASPEKAGECMGKAIGVAIGTGVGTKGLTLAIDATKKATSVAGKALGNAAQLAAKCVGEICGVASSKMQLGFKSASTLKDAAKVGAIESVSSGASRGRKSQTEDSLASQSKGFSTDNKLPSNKNDLSDFAAVSARQRAQALTPKNNIISLSERARRDPQLKNGMDKTGPKGMAKVIQLPPAQAERVLRTVDEFTMDELKVFKEEVQKPEWRWCQ